jgi:type IV secretory pathway VirJ component
VTRPLPHRGGRRLALQLAAAACCWVISAAAAAARPAAAAAAVATRPSAAPTAAAAGAVEHQTYGRFGQVSIYRRGPAPNGVVVLLSDADGWSPRAEALARSLESLDALVIGLDLQYYLGRSERLTQDCTYPAGDLEMLSKLVQKTLELPAYTPPVLAGFGAGATLAYGALAQAPGGSYAGAISLGFCPEIAASHPLCAGGGLTSKPLPGGGAYQLQPVASLPQPWLLAPPPAGPAGRCGGAAAEAFAARIKGAAVVSPPKGSGRRQASADLRASSGLKQAYLRVRNDADLARPPETPTRKALGDLPLLELPVPGSTGDTLAVIVSGDGGWAGLDRDVASLLADRGFPVVGLNTLQYFWKPRTPEGAAADLGRILRTYLTAWKRKDALLVGYSLGGEVLPFMVDRLPPDLLAKVRMVALLGPGRTTSFQFRLSEWLGHGGGENRPVAPEVARLKGKPVVCIYGGGEKATSLCSMLGSLATPVELPGAHYLGSDPRAVVDAIQRHLEKGAAAQKEAGQTEGSSGTPTAAGTDAKPAAPGQTQTAPKEKGRSRATPPPPANPPPAPGGGVAVSASAGSLVAMAMTWIGNGVTTPALGGMGRGPRWMAAGLGFAAEPATATPAKPASAAPPGDETMQYGRFGTLHLERRTPHPANIVLFFSGEAGWDATAAQMARVFAQRDFLAVGIDTRHYLGRLAEQQQCAYTAGSLENLSKVVQKRLGFPSYLHPVVAGYAGGSALAYGALAQAPAKTFRGGLGVAFCGDLPGDQPLCPGHGLALRPGTRSRFQLLPAQGLEQPFLALQAASGGHCPGAAAAELTRAAPEGEVVTIAGGGQVFAQPRLWQPGLRQAIDRLLAPRHRTARPNAPVAAAEVVGSKAFPDLPLIEMASAGAPGGPLAVVLSGDGGWASVDREVAKVLAGQRGVPVVGLDLLEYFWSGRTPEAAAADLQRVLRHYLGALNRGQVLLVGYSLGADVLPFMANRLPADLLDRVRVIALLGPSHSTPFEIRIKEDKGSELPVLPEVEKLRGRPVLCIAAAGEQDSLCSDLRSDLGETVELQGSHAFNGDYEQLADRILKGVQPAPGAHPAGGSHPPGGGSRPAAGGSHSTAAADSTRKVDAARGGKSIARGRSRPMEDDRGDDGGRAGRAPRGSALGRRRLFHAHREHALQVVARVGAEGDQGLGADDAFDLEHLVGHRRGNRLVVGDPRHRHDVELAGDGVDLGDRRKLHQLLGHLVDPGFLHHQQDDGADHDGPSPWPARERRPERSPLYNTPRHLPRSAKAARPRGAPSAITLELHPENRRPAALALREFAAGRSSTSPPGPSWSRAGPW